jgi:hypothetical protein
MAVCTAVALLQTLAAFQIVPNQSTPNNWLVSGLQNPLILYVIYISYIG